MDSGSPASDGGAVRDADDASTREDAGANGGANVDDGGALDDASTSDDADEDGGADVACVPFVYEVAKAQHPVDIIWMVDNSSSMQPAVASVTEGLNTFAKRIADAQLDYKVILLSLRSKTSPVTVLGSKRYPVCIPTPLAGDDDCGNGPRFFHSSIDVRSTQALEQFLGTLGQTTGYKPTDDRGGEPWADQLRPGATKTIVMVTDDNARLSANDFETFAGGKNPFNSSTLPPGLLDASWNGLFDGYLFSGIYGWGSEDNAAVRCQYGDNTSAASSGATYTQLVTTTGGVRAQICEGADAWDPFFAALAQTIQQTSPLSCELTIPTPSEGAFEPARLSVRIAGKDLDPTPGQVGGAEGCGAAGGWYYDDPTTPTTVLLCPVSCDAARDEVGVGKDGHIELLFGCKTIAVSE